MTKLKNDSTKSAGEERVDDNANLQRLRPEVVVSVTITLVLRRPLHRRHL